MKNINHKIYNENKRKSLLRLFILHFIFYIAPGHAKTVDSLHLPPPPLKAPATRPAALTAVMDESDRHNLLAAFLKSGWLGESGRDLHDFAGFAEVYLLEPDPCNTITVEIKAGCTTYVNATYARIED